MKYMKNLKQTNVEGNETPNDNVNIRITQDESVRTGVTAKDENLGIKVAHRDILR